MLTLSSTWPKLLHTNKIIWTHICLPTHTITSMLSKKTFFMHRVTGTVEETTNVKNLNTHHISFLEYYFVCYFWTPDTKGCGFSTLSVWMNALTMQNYFVSRVEHWSQKDKHTEENLIFTLTAFFFFGKPKTRQYFTLCVLCSGHQKRCEWWSGFFSFLSQQAFAPLKQPWAIPSSSSTTFL